MRILNKNFSAFKSPLNYGKFRKPVSFDFSHEIILEINSKKISYPKNKEDLNLIHAKSISDMKTLIKSITQIKENHQYLEFNENKYLKFKRSTQIYKITSLNKESHFFRCLLKFEGPSDDKKTIKKELNINNLIKSRELETEIRIIEENYIKIDNMLNHLIQLQFNNQLEKLFEDQNYLDSFIEYLILSDLKSNENFIFENSTFNKYYKNLLQEKILINNSIEKYEISLTNNKDCLFNIINNLKFKLEHRRILNKVLFIPSNKLRKIPRIIELNESLVMGIINCTPDSIANAFLSQTQNLQEKFCNKGFLENFEKTEYSLDDKYKLIIEMLKKNKKSIDIVDIGGESTRPNSDIIDQNIEYERIAKLITQIRNDEDLKDLVISVDTRKSFVAEKSLEIGADIINDVSGGSFDTEMINVLKKFECPYVLMHMRGLPQNMLEKHYLNYGDDFIKVLLEELDEKIEKFRSEKIYDFNIIIDPGIGFAKNIKHNLEIIKNLRYLKQYYFNCLLIGASRKRFLKTILEKNDTHNGDILINSKLVQERVDIIRVHDYESCKDVIKFMNYFDSELYKH